MAIVVMDANTRKISDARTLAIQMAQAMTAAAGTGVDDLFRRFGPNYRWLVTLTVMTGAIAMGFATSMVNVAVPSVMGAFGIVIHSRLSLGTTIAPVMTVRVTSQR